MVAFLWIDLAALAVCSIVAALDAEVQWGSVRLGRPVYGLLVLAGLLGVYSVVLREGFLPIPGWGIMAFAFLFLPFLWQSFIDLETTDRLARDELEELLLGNDFEELRWTSGQMVLSVGKRRLRMEWNSRKEAGGIVVELNVHPSQMPVTVSRPHVALIENEEHLTRVREEIRERRAHGERSTDT